MGNPRRGYVLIAVLWALMLCGVLAASFAATARRGADQSADQRARAESRMLARAGCIQGAKDVALALGNRSYAAVDGASGPGAPTSASARGYQIEGLPEFPPEVAGAGGFMGIIAQRMQQLAEARQAREGQNEQEAPSDARGRTNEGQTASTVEDEPAPAPLIAIGVGEFQLSGSAVRVWQESEAGKINLNLAPKWMVASLLATLGVEPSRVPAVIEAMEAHRLLRETEDARRERRRYEPSDPREAPLAGAPFQRLGELLDIPGFPREIYDELTRAATVFGSGGIDPNYAPAAVWITLGVQDQRTIAAIADEQRLLRRITPSRLERLIGSGLHRVIEGYVAQVEQPMFTVRARVEVDGVTSRWTMRMTMDASMTPRLVESREGWM